MPTPFNPAANPQVAAFLPYAVVSATSAAPGHAPANVASLLRPWWTFRTATGAGAQYLILDRGVDPVPLTVLLVANANFHSCDYAECDTVDGIYTELGNVTIPENERLRSYPDPSLPRRNGWLILPTPSTQRYTRLHPLITGGPFPYYEAGALGLIGPVRTLTRGFPAWVYRLVEPSLETVLVGDGVQGTSEGPDYIAYTLGVRWNLNKAACMADLLAIKQFGKYQPFAFYENRGDPAQGYVLIRTADLEITEAGIKFSTTLPFREPV
jgi:hypothetical protein